MSIACNLCTFAGSMSVLLCPRASEPRSLCKCRSSSRGFAHIALMTGSTSLGKAFTRWPCRPAPAPSIAAEAPFETARRDLRLLIELRAETGGGGNIEILWPTANDCQILVFGNPLDGKTLALHRGPCRSPCLRVSLHAVHYRPVPCALVNDRDPTQQSNKNRISPAGGAGQGQPVGFNHASKPLSIHYARRQAPVSGRTPCSAGRLGTSPAAMWLSLIVAASYSSSSAPTRSSQYVRYGQHAMQLLPAQRSYQVEYQQSDPYDMDSVLHMSCPERPMATH